MLDHFSSHQFKDTDGNPAGGHTFGRGFAIAWQNGPLGRGDDRKDPNGAFVETIIAAARDRLDFYQQGKFNSDYNATAITHLDAALRALNQRTIDREKRDVEGTHSL